MAVTTMSSYFNIFQYFSILIHIINVYMTNGDVTHSATYKRMDTVEQSVYAVWDITWMSADWWHSC